MVFVIMIYSLIKHLFAELLIFIFLNVFLLFLFVLVNGSFVFNDTWLEFSARILFLGEVIFILNRLLIFFKVVKVNNYNFLTILKLNILNYFFYSICLAVICYSKI